MAPEHGEPPLKILLLNHLWFATELRERGHEVFTASWIHDNAELKFERYTTLDALLALLPPSFSPDRIVYYDDSHLPSVLGLDGAAIPTVFVSVDAHHHHHWHRFFAHCFDLTLVAQKDYLPQLCWATQDEIGDSLRWFPAWTPAVLKPHAEKAIDVCFRGTLDPQLHPQRHRFFSELQKLATVDAASGPYWRDYPKSKIVVNQTISGDLNFRVFEALSGGALLITPRIGNGLAELFSDGADLVTYREGDAADAAEKISYYLTHEEERAAIATSGRHKVLTSHTAAVRAGQLATALTTLTKRTPALPHFAAAVIERITASHVLREGGDGVTVKRLSERSAERFVASAEAAELLSDDFRAHVVSTKLLLRQFSSPEFRLAFSERIAAAYDEDVLLALSLADDLLSVGRQAEALHVAERFSDKPLELLKAVPRLMGEVMSSVQLTAEGR